MRYRRAAKEETPCITDKAPRPAFNAEADEKLIHDVQYRGVGDEPATLRSRLSKRGSRAGTCRDDENVHRDQHQTTASAGRIE
jgi:hypothetical protein